MALLASLSSNARLWSSPSAVKLSQRDAIFFNQKMQVCMSCYFPEFMALLHTGGFKWEACLQIILPGNAFSPGASSGFPLTLETLAYEIKCKCLNLNVSTSLT